jgi:flagellar basal body-associated protein FliL
MNFDVSRLRKSDQIIGGSAILFFIFLFFFKWYGESSSGASIGGVNVGATNVSFSGWHTFSNSRWIWLITIIVALVAVAVTSGALKFQSPVQLSVAVAALGALSTLLIFYRIVHHPSASASYGSFHASVGIKIGIWLGLIAAAGVTYGGYLAMRDEGTSIADVREQASAAVSNMSSQSDAPKPPASSTTTSTAGVDAPASTEPAAPPIPPPADPEL